MTAEATTAHKVGLALRRRIPLLLLALIGLLGLWEAGRVEIGTISHPGAGLWPLVTAVCTLALTAVLLVRPAEEVEPLSRSQMVRVALFVAGFAGFILAFERIGFPIPAFLLMVLLLRAIGRVGWVATLLTAAGTTAGVFFVFHTLLRVPLI